MRVYIYINILCTHMYIISLPVESTIVSLGLRLKGLGFKISVGGFYGRGGVNRV